MKYFDDELQRIKESKLYRHINRVEKVVNSTIVIGDKRYINFGSNNYLGMATHRDVIKKGQEVLEEFGSNICSAQTLCGYSRYHRTLSDKLRKLFGVEETLLFSSGYLANLSILQVFPKEETEIYMDIYNHRSLIDGARLAGIKLFFYKHQNYEQLKKLLNRSKSPYKIVATDTVFSMEGDIANILELLKIQQEYGTFLILDDAHGFLVLENHIFDYFKVNITSLKKFIYVATFSKAIGCLGGFVLGEIVVLELIKNKVGTFLFDTALPPHICAMSEKAIDIVLNNKKYTKKLKENINFLNKRFNTNQDTPIFIKKYADIERLNTVYQNLLENGIYVPAIKPPTVPKGGGRLRISLSAQHHIKHLENLVKCLSH